MKGKIAAKSMIERHDWLIFGLLLFIGLGIHLYSTWGGLIWTSDSFNYWAASRSFQSDKIFLAWDGGSFTFWPPLFPIILSFFSETSYHIFHSLCFLSSLLFIYLFLKRISNKNSALISLAIFTISVYPYITSSFLWSETIFILLLYSGIFYFDLWLQHDKKVIYLILSTLLLSMLCLQRNAGVFIIVGLSISCLIFFLKNRDWRFLVKMAVIHLIIVTPNILWNIYQKTTNAQEFDFSNRPFAIDFFTNLETLSIELSRFFIPLPEDSNSIITIVLGLIVLTIIIRPKLKTLPLSIFISYITFFLLMPKFELSETGRFLTPVFPIIILQLVHFSKRTVSKLSSRKMKLLISAFLALIIVYNIARTVKNVSQWNYRSIHHPKSAKIFF